MTPLTATAPNNTSPPTMNTITLTIDQWETICGWIAGGASLDYWTDERGEAHSKKESIYADTREEAFRVQRLISRDYATLTGQEVA